MTGNPEVISSPVGLVPTNALGSRNAIGRISHGQSPSPASDPETYCGLPNPGSER